MTWLNHEPTKEEIAATVVTAQKIANRHSRTVTVCRNHRLRGPAFSRPQWEPIILVWEATRPQLLNNHETAYPLVIVEPEPVNA